jgi:hypothetical protein
MWLKVSRAECASEYGRLAFSHQSPPWSQEGRTGIETNGSAGLPGCCVLLAHRHGTGLGFSPPGVIVMKRRSSAATSIATGSHPAACWSRLTDARRWCACQTPVSEPSVLATDCREVLELSQVPGGSHQRLGRTSRKYVDLSMPT